MKYITLERNAQYSDPKQLSVARINILIYSYVHTSPTLKPITQQLMFNKAFIQTITFNYKNEMPSLKNIFFIIDK